MLDEAENCDRIALLDKGKVIEEGTPSSLRESVGRQILSIQSKDPDTLKIKIEKEFSRSVLIVNREVRVGGTLGQDVVAPLMNRFPADIESITVGKPTLEDFFIQKTGHGFFSESSEFEGRS